MRLHHREARLAKHFFSSDACVQIGLGMLQVLSAAAMATHLACLDCSQLLGVIFLIIIICFLLALSRLSPSAFLSGALAPSQVLPEALAQDLPT